MLLVSVGWNTNCWPRSPSCLPKWWCCSSLQISDFGSHLNDNIEGHPLGLGRVRTYLSTWWHGDTILKARTVATNKYIYAYTPFLTSGSANFTRHQDKDGRYISINLIPTTDTFRMTWISYAMGFAKRNNLTKSASFHLARAIQKSLYICVDIHCISKETRPPLNILRPSATHRWRGNNVKHIGHDHTCTWLLRSTAMPCPLSFLTLPRMDSGLDSMAMPPLQTELHFEDSHLNGLRMFEGL